jgi:regulator of sirC expression with transglutaminase-like and TPR domain
MAILEPQTATFSKLASAADDAIDVALGAALIAKDVYPDLDVPELVRRLHDLAGPLAGGALAGLSLTAQADAVSERFRDLGFQGNVEDYYDPRNSLLPDVLERRTGIPITLTVVWCAIAHRAGVLARGVGFPGHFLARVDALASLGGLRARFDARPVIVDPFAGGRVVSDDDARSLLRRSLGEGAELHPMLLEPASSRTTLVRMLTNLKAVWANKGEHTRAFVAIDRIVTLVPDSARMLRERAGVALRLGLDDLARADLSRVLELEPEAPDAPGIEKRLRELRRSPKNAPN